MYTPTSNLGLKNLRVGGYRSEYLVISYIVITIDDIYGFESNPRDLTRARVTFIHDIIL